MKTETGDFIKIQEHLTCDSQPENFVVGKSPVTICGVDDTKATRRIKESLRRVLGSGILNPALEPINPALSPNGERPLRSALIHEFSGTAFINMSLSDGSRYPVHTRLVGVNGEGLASPDKLNVITGLCLFSATSVKGVEDNGNTFYLTDTYANGGLDRPLVNIKIDQRLQPYEVEAIKRLTKFISELNPAKPIEIGLAIPRLEYWLYALDGYERGCIDQDLMLKWFKTVDQRAEGLTRLLSKRLPDRSRVRVVTPLGPLEELLRDAVASGRRDLFTEAVDNLKSTSPLWRTSIRAVDELADVDPKKEKPIDSFTALNYLSYVMGYLEMVENDDRFLVAVENPEESRIIDRAGAILAKNGQPSTIVGLYPHTNLAVRKSPHNQDKLFLYFYNPNGSHSKALREVAKAA